MKELFPEYDHSESLNYPDVWESALFVFDTNVLLNLYRYHESTRRELLKILKTLEDRIWIPHHVALEFQRNRLSVIASQGNGFKEMRTILTTTKNKLKDDIYKLGLHNRHTLINAEKLINDFEELTNNFSKELETLESSQQKINEHDPIKKLIEELFSGKVGSAHKLQKEVDDLSKEAETRYKLKIPPGYKDDEKDKNKPDDFMHKGIFYKRKYGDYIAWSQTLDKAQTLTSKKLIFITDDGKEDWWQKLNGEGSSNNVGPRTELIDEALRIGKLEAFLMYRPEGFLKYAKESLQASVSEDAMNDVRKISISNTVTHLTDSYVDLTSTNAEYAIKDWLSTTFQYVEGVRANFPDFIVHHEEEILAFEIFLFTPDRLDRELRIFNDICETESFFNEDLFDDLTIIWVVNKESDLPALSKILKKHTNFNHNRNISIQAALMESTGNFPTITKLWPINTW
ncbi:PIN-like domain-containing protein [Pseudomonas sp. R2-60-08W]|uniref:PIN-like domain-containing protein n=1 Tax=Pseudomonas sp. R2-60-08W TaxID=1173280 RepID=UPI000F57198E|nr:PIN-like domain-containing protein [Pseudomonas sp. R2-60-08W]AZF28157.1 hypothetical protein C4J90_4007 [Pseudomonas sp. R2-60-08W]